MNRIGYTLVTEGSSDRLLKYPIEWLLERLTSLTFDGEWADPRVFKKQKQENMQKQEKKLIGKLAPALEYYPCDLLFVHRDADRDPPETRITEIEDAVGQLSSSPPVVCVVPVRKTEAWVLIDKQALREAAGNPNGKVDLGFPALRDLESIPDPKATLFELLATAGGLQRRRLKSLNKFRARQRVAQLIDDFSPLEKLPAFQRFRAQLKGVLEQEGWT